MSIKRYITSTLLLILISVFAPTTLLTAQDHSDDHTGETHIEADAHDGSSETNDVAHGDDHHKNEDDSHGSTHDDDHGEEEFNAEEVIMHHIKDSHEWHILTTKSGHHVSVPLPVILFSKHSGFHVFLSNKLAHGHNYIGFEVAHGTYNVPGKDGQSVEKSLDGKIIELDAEGHIVKAGLPLDFSITKNAFMMFLCVTILLIVFLRLAKSYKKVGVSAPKGLQGFLEPLIVFVEEDIAIPNIGEGKHARFMPYLLTVFFFILIHNLFGLIPFFPFGANVTGNIAVTLVLATFTLFITNFNGNKGYWRHIFATPGVPVWLLPIMIPVELLGILTKPFALMIRLFANITAGHIIVLSLVSLIFFAKSIFMAVPSMILVVFMDMIEILVAFLQAYVFTLLSALFIGLAMPEHHHE